jgi:hypothetical protein
MDAATLAGLLADDGRRRVVAALLLGATSLEEVVTASGLSSRQAITALGRLMTAALVTDVDGSYEIVAGAFGEAARSSRRDAGPEASEASGGTDEAKVLRAFVRGGQLVSIPTSRSKRLIVLDRLAQMFEPGLRYSERDVNDLLRPWHPDTAALRRYLVDEEFLSRDHGEYWRSGGAVDAT